MLAWIAVFLPAWMRARQQAPFTATERFKRRMELIAPRPRGGRWIVMPEPYDRLARASFKRGQRRRTRILMFLIFAVAMSLVVAAFAGHGWWSMQIALDFSLAIYVALLVEAKRRREEQRTKVRNIARPARRARDREVVVFEHANANR